MNIIFNDHKESKAQNHVSTFRLNSLEQIFPPELDYWKINEDATSAEEFIAVAQRKLESLNNRVKILENLLESLKRFAKDGKQFDDSIEVSRIVHGHGGRNLLLVQNGCGFSNWQYASMEDSIDLHARVLDMRLTDVLWKAQKQEKIVQELQNLLKDKRSIDNSQIKHYIVEGSPDYITDSFNSFNINLESSSPNPSTRNSFFYSDKEGIEVIGEEWIDEYSFTI